MTGTVDRCSVESPSKSHRRHSLVCCSVSTGTVMQPDHPFFFFNDPAPTEISPLSLHDPLPISATDPQAGGCAPACAEYACAGSSLYSGRERRAASDWMISQKGQKGETWKPISIFKRPRTRAREIGRAHV